jgi:hypothetical protein
MDETTRLHIRVKFKISIFGVVIASCSLDVSPEHANRIFKRKLVELLNEKLLLKLR